MFTKKLQMQTKKLHLLSWLLCYQIVENIACWSKTTVINYQNTWDQYNKKSKKNKNGTQEHWTIPDSQKEVYGRWIAEYTNNQTKEQIMGLLGAAGEPPAGMIIPETWKGYGRGYGGLNPPPWAIMPKSYGKPEFCFMDPAIGNCVHKLKRWGYNSFMAKCNSFTYSGCGGNVNNFRTQARCEEVCMNPIQSNCQKIGEYIEY